MENRSTSSIFWDRGYIRQAQRPLNCLLFIILPLALYQAFALRYGTQLLAPRDLARLLAYFGASAALLAPALIVGVLLAQHFLERCKWTFQPAVLRRARRPGRSWSPVPTWATLVGWPLLFIARRVLDAQEGLSKQ